MQKETDYVVIPLHIEYLLMRPANSASLPFDRLRANGL